MVLNMIHILFFITTKSNNCFGDGQSCKRSYFFYMTNLQNHHKMLTVYTKQDCVFCTLLNNYLTRKKIEFISENCEDIKALVEKTGSKTFPQVFIGDKFLGGYDEVRGFKLDEVTGHRLKEISGEVEESMCKEDKEFDRFILFNGKTENEYSDVFDLYRTQIAAFWTVEEIDLVDDMAHWNNSTDNEKHFIKMVLAFFASLDQIVMENVSVNFADEIIIPQVRSHFAIQNFMESVHATSYALLIQTYIKDPIEQSKILRSIQTIPVIKKKADWVMKWMDPSTVSLAERLVAFLALEGIQFSGSFCAIFWLKKRSMFPGLCFANALISRDEALHARGSVMIYKHLENKLSQERVHEIIKDSVDMEIEFSQEALPVSLIGMNCESMGQYIKFVADYWLEALGYESLYGVENPFPFMDMISLQGKENFFERNVTSYSKAGSGTTIEEQAFSLDAEF